MALSLDHIVIAVQDLNAAIQDYRDLGFTVVRGGVHANRATQNALISFADGTYLELLAATGDPPAPGLIDFSALLRQGEGLAGFALRSDDLETDAKRLRAEGFAVGEMIPGERRREDGTPVRWKLALLDGGFAPFLIQDVTPRRRRISDDPAVTTHANRAIGLDAIIIAVRDRAVTAARYSTLLATTPLEVSPDESMIGGVVLRGSGEEMPSSEKLIALRLVCDTALDHRFPFDRTHGVRFEPVLRKPARSG